MHVIARTSKRLVALSLSAALALNPLMPLAAFATEVEASEQEAPTALTTDDAEPAQDTSADTSTTDAPEATEGEPEAPSQVVEEEQVEVTQTDDDGDADVEVTADGVDKADAVSGESTSVTTQSDSTAPLGDLHVFYRAHVQKIGWQDWVSDGALAGTSGKARRVEALRLNLKDSEGQIVEGIEYQAHVQKVGWQDWVSDGDLAGTTGKSRRVEALRIKLSDSLSQNYDIWYRTHVQSYGWLGWTSNGSTTGSTSCAKRLEAIEIVILPKGSNAPGDTSNPCVDGTHLSMRGHIQKLGWKSADSAVGTTGRGLRIEGFSAKLVSGEYAGGVQYQAHVQKIGWQGMRSNGQKAGTTGRSLRLEAITFELTGEASEHYDIWYRVHVQRYGWLGWTSNGARAGTEGLSLRIERIETVILPKGSPAPVSANTSHDAAYIAATSVSYASKVLNGSWLDAVSDGKTSGTTGKSTSIELVSMNLNNSAGSTSGSITYQVHSLNGGWTSASDGAQAGTSGLAMDSMRVSLSGDVASAYDVYYRTHVSGIGWLQWTSNNELAGTSGLGKKIEAYQVRLVAKGKDAPSNDEAKRATPYYDSIYAKQSAQALVKANDKQRRIVNSALSTPSPGAGLCADWVERVYANAGYGMYWGNADDLYHEYCTYSEKCDLKVGMIVAVSSHPHSYLGSIYGHVGIYIGDDMIMDNIGNIRKVSLDDWLAYYGASVTPKWGWLGNVKLA